MPVVGATEPGRGQTEPLSEELRGMWSCRTWVLPRSPTRSPLERGAIEGESPVEEGEKGDSRYPEYRSLDLERESGWH